MTRDRDLCVLDDVTVIRATEKAILVRLTIERPRVGQPAEAVTVEVWIAQSQIDDDSEVWKAGDEGTLVIPQWLADEKGIG